MCGWPTCKRVTNFGQKITHSARALKHFGNTALLAAEARVCRGWPPRHIPVVVGGGGVGLLDLRDGDIAILRLPAFGGLLDLPGLALGGRVLDLHVNVGHRSRRYRSGVANTMRAISPDAVATRIRMKSAAAGSRSGIIPECCERAEGARFKFGRVTERAGARAAPRPAARPR
ncbi:hypothetical protein EVAR_47796_1 [Eumeta japonica]|uniref:Uncharacterized protein n=1 Tax=Eumeta variegata TaxID=151549 RepID=A0A4C1ZBU1_EUMVA|nr:hypothetical protein EVAR_47796_1 [Eumeta japonica]